MTCHYGRYERYEAEYPLSRGPDAGQYVWVWKIEEKQSDVKLATTMILDALVAEPAVEAAVLVSNDSDLVFPVKRLRREGVPVGVINPHPKRPSGELASVASFYRKVKPGKVAACQMPDQLEDERGDFAIPDRWLVRHPENGDDLELVSQ